MKNYICIFSVLLFAYCANIVPPEGGPKDILAPKLNFATPANKHLNFSQNKIELIFDEYIQISDYKSIQLSPICEPKPKIEVQGKKIIISLNCPLEPESTYTINFGQTIMDVNEKNPLNNFKYVFSTGNKIDSLYLEGVAKNLFYGSKLEGVVVGLFKSSDLKTPHYFTSTNNLGEFLIQNIKGEEYILFGFKDENNNLKYDVGELASTPQHISQFNTNMSLDLFLPELDYPILDVKNTYKNMISFTHELISDSILITNMMIIYSIQMAVFYIVIQLHHISLNTQSHHIDLMLD